MRAGEMMMVEMKAIRGYELRERIGSGGFGVVYRAYQTTVGREVAIKIILPHFANHPDFIRRFETEAQLIARLEHLHIVPLYDYWRDPDGAYLVMRWLRGNSLRDALKQGPFQPEAAAQLLDQVASALDMAHRHHVVHRDLKPANVLLDEEGNAYLSDFGIAKDVGDADGGGQTASGVIVGSPDYLAPEQARGDPVMPQTDIYSLGVMLYEILTGQHPFPDKTPVERMYQHLNDPLPAITSLPDDLREGVNAVIRKATAKNPAHRFANALDMAAAFREATASTMTPAGGSLVEQLTLREQEILRYIIDGCSNQEIAQRLFVTVATVKWHVWQLYRKLRVRSRVQAIARARELKLMVSDATPEAPGSEATFVAPPDMENPYKGLRPFEAADARDFFGREKLVQRLVKRLGENHRPARFLAVVGPSGSGKSSVVKAGLVPALWRGDLPGSDRWFVVEMAPGARPLDELEVALTRIAAARTDNLREHLERNQNGLLRVAGLILPNDGSELVIVIDQFEEVFTLIQDEPARAHFLKLIHAAVTDPRSRVRVIVTLRADFYDRPLHYPEFGELVRSHMETVLPLSAEELEEAVVKPAQRVGVTFEPGLAATIIADSNYQPGALPLLQYALTELFEQRDERLLTHKAYKALGGAVGALAQRADEIYLEQSLAGQEATRQMFLRLVTLGEDAEDTRRRVPRSELLGVAVEGDVMDELIDTFAAYRLLTLDHDRVTRSPTVEMAHEAILREWTRLQSWLEASRHDIHQQRILAAAAADWFRAGKDPSYLLRGARLEQFAGWAAETPIALTQKEREFVDVSRAHQAAEQAAERDRQAHELELAQRAAESQRKAADRMRYLVVGLVLFLIAAVAQLLFTIGQRNEAESARATSDANARIARDNAAQAQELALVNGAQAALAKGDAEAALALAVAANRIPNPPAQAQRILSEAAYPPGPVRLFAGPKSNALRAAFSRDGGTLIAGGTDNRAYVWDSESGRLLHTLSGHTNWVVAVGIRPDGRAAITFGRDRNIIVWDLDTGQEIRRFGSDQILGPEALAAAFSPDGRYVLTNNGALPGLYPDQVPLLLLWDVTTGELARTFQGHTEGIGGIAFSPDGQRVLSGAFRGELILWDVATGDVLERFGGNNADWRTMPSDIAFGPDGRLAYVKRMDGALTIWDLERRTPMHRLGETYPGESWAWTQLAVSPDGRMVASVLADGRMGLWDAHTGAALGPLAAWGFGVAFSPDSRYLLSGDVPALRLWDLQDGAQVGVFDAELPVAGFALSPDGATLYATAGTLMGAETKDCRFMAFDVASGRVLRRVQIATDQDGLGWCALWGVPVVGPDGRTVLTSVDERVIVLDAATGEQLRTFSGHHASISAIALSPDGRTALSGDFDGQLLLWDVQAGQEIRRFSGHTGRVAAITFVPGAHTALSTGGNGDILEWDLATGQLIRRLHPSTGSAYSLEMSPDGQTLLTGDGSGQATLWDYATGQPAHVLTSGANGAAAHFTADGASILIEGAALLDPASGETIRRYTTGGRVVVSPDGSAFFTVSPVSDTAVTRWRIDSADQLVAWALANRYVPELGCHERALYGLAPGCDEAGIFATRTPYPTAPFLPFSTPTQAAQAIAGASAAITPTVTPRPLLIVRAGENRGEVSAGDYQAWQYTGKAGERLFIRAEADNPLNGSAPRPGALDTLLIVTAPDGRDLNVYDSGGGMVFGAPHSDDIEAGVNTDSLVDGLVLPVDGVYQIIVSGSGFRSGGAYTLVVESQPPEDE
ncbi:MAG: protein kinase [Anaerolineae bacterium]|nr:protein kinase [Anaerolineae bacterium]